MHDKKEITGAMLLMMILGAIVIILVGAVFLYNRLSEDVTPDILQPPDNRHSAAPESPPSIGQTEGEGQKPHQDEGDDNANANGNGNGNGNGIIAPDITVRDFDGNEIKLSDLLGKPIVLNFWASWCPPCIAEMPEFNDVFIDLGEDVNFMMVCAVDGARETRESGAAFIEENGYVFPVYYDELQEAAQIFGIRSLPNTFFIDADGYVITRADGRINEELLRLGISYIME